MAKVRSKWASKTPSVSGTFSPGEWSDAGVLPMPGGFVLVKNDSEYLYLALDLVGDTGNTPGTGDYFWLSFDIDRTGTITSNSDVNYGIYPSLPIRLARQCYLGPGTWTGILGGPTTSLCTQGFGPSPHSGTPHRIWEMRIALSEIGLSSLGSLTYPYLRFGLRVASTTPSFVTDFPPNFFTNFSSLHEILLATGPEHVFPPNTAGIVIGGVGLIPATAIVDGRANTVAPYQPTVSMAAFSGILNFIFNRQTITGLWGAGARKYRIVHSFQGVYSNLRRTWANYRWAGDKFVLETFGPDGNDCYSLPAPINDYSTKDLLFQWNSTGGSGDPVVPSGLHQFRVEFLNASGVSVPSPQQVLTLYVDNSLPELQIFDITYRGASVKPCDIIDIAETADPVRVHFKALDPEGHLRSFGLSAHYGGPGTPPVNLLPPGVGSYPGGMWQGVADQWVDCPVSPKFPPVTCGYQFRLSAAPRCTNGYGYVGYSETTFHVVFRRSGAPTITVKPIIPFGLKPEITGLKPATE